MGDGFNINEMISDYRALRASVTKLFREATRIKQSDINDLIRFNEGIDQATKRDGGNKYSLYHTNPT